ncbi:MAG: Fur family transcriptional regulator, peroxide stress response regulator [Thermoanaerobacter sp.]|uniref:Fur family transcriptional regulator n=1 Tax=Desulfofundulus thermocisternus TaxID=42471 RepID=UPI000488E274|nr:transcriptional repressor [Desulfofundulus thermocisternus]MDK2887460.1 Fur family transcriptional regulator, peroxide stress response regulator [Thermoanaerobacter sp.]
MIKPRRMTKQKKLILEILRNTNTHPTADWIYEQARKQIPDISLGTIYRNLNNLKQAGEIMELNYGSTFSRFDGNPQNHYHFVCDGCGRIFDLDLPLMNNLEEKVSSLTGMQVTRHRLEFYGYCRECQAKQSEEEKQQPDEV